MLKDILSFIPDRPKDVHQSHPDLNGISPEALFPLLEPEPHEALLLSGGRHPLSRYSYLGLDPFLIMTAHGRQVSLETLPDRNLKTVSADPFDILRMLLQAYKQLPCQGFPPFWSGGIGYLGYEAGRLLERLPCTTEDDLKLPDLYFAFYRSLLCYNHSQKTYSLFRLDLHGRNADQQQHGKEEICSRVLQAGRKRQYPDRGPLNTLPLQLTSLFSRDQYIETIRKVLHYIREGDIYQANLSQRFQTPYNGDPYSLFLKLFHINPAPFFAYLDTGSFQVVSSSPERFLLKQGNRIETRPIKGTLPRGLSRAQDRENARALLQSEKNRAELAMITDLLRNDLGRVSEFGSVNVKNPAFLEAYTNVFHLVSTVCSQLEKGKDLIDLIRATFPGGSITGCPKIRAMEIIDELEPTVRSVYTGSIGYLGWDGAMDLNIAIRTILLNGSDLYYQVGGGIVYDSDPREEYEETLHKAASMKEALISMSCAGSSVQELSVMDQP